MVVLALIAAWLLLVAGLLASIFHAGAGSLGAK
jgi:DMSO reductase anchor subunit